MTINIGDDVTINAVVVDVTASGNAIVKLKKGGKILITPEEINTIRPKVIVSEQDMRKGE